MLDYKLRVKKELIINLIWLVRPPFKPFDGFGLEMICIDMQYFWVSFPLYINFMF